METTTATTEISTQTTAALAAEIAEIWAAEQAARSTARLYTDEYLACDQMAAHQSWLSHAYRLASETRLAYSAVRTGVRSTGYTGEGVWVGDAGELLGAALEVRGLWGEYVALLLTAADRSAPDDARYEALQRADAMGKTRA